MDFPRVTCNDVNVLASMCAISQEKAITSLKQCSSSLFVLLYQRLFNCTIKGIESSPFKLEQKKWNVRCVLNELHDKRGIDVSGIDEEQIVQLNEDHISRLIMLFMNIAYDMQLQGVSMGPSLMPPNAAATPAVTPPPPAAAAGTAARPVLAEIPHESTQGGAWYVPVASDPVKTSAERARPPYQHPPPPPPQQQQQQQQQHHLNLTGTGETVHSHRPPHHAHDLQPPHPLLEGEHAGDHDDGASDGSYGIAEEEEDTGAIPTTQLVKAWNDEVIPPGRSSRIIDSAELLDVRERLSMLDEFVAETARERMRERASRESQQRMAHARRGAGAAHLEPRDARHMAPVPRSLVPDTLASDEAIRRRPKRMIDYTLRDEKIEMLRSMRFMDDLQKDVRRRMVQQHSNATRQMRAEVRHTLEEDRREKLARKRQIKEEDQKYRNAYTSIVEAACNDLRVARDVMLGRTRELALCQTNSLRESRRMCHYMKRESNERMRHDLLRYASTVTGWQSHFAS